MRQKINEIEIHYVRNKKTGAIDDFKFKQEYYMKVKCIYITGESLSQKFIDIGWTKQSQMYLKINQEYEVYGMYYYSGIFKYLVVEDDSSPNWYPSEIFEIVNNKIPTWWYFDMIDNPKGGIEALWGYDELINNEDHYDNLINREKVDLEIFHKRKKTIENEGL